MTRTDRLELLLVCRGGRARSPVVSAVLSTWAAAHGIRPRPNIESNGWSADAGQPLFPDAAELVQGLTGGASSHSARPFDPARASAADLVITFERRLMLRILAEDAGLLGRCYTLRELIRLSDSPGWDARWNGTSELASRLHRIRPRVEAGDDDTPDPAGLRQRLRRRSLENLVTEATVAAPIILGEGQVGSTR